MQILVAEDDRDIANLIAHYMQKSGWHPHIATSGDEALAHVADWRWLVERSDSPWYPTMRLYRQRRPGEWAAVFERMAHDLAAEAGLAKGGR